MRSAGSGLLLLLDLCAYWCLVPFASIFASIALVWWAVCMSNIGAAQTMSHPICCVADTLHFVTVFASSSHQASKAAIWRCPAALVRSHYISVHPCVQLSQFGSCINQHAFHDSAHVAAGRCTTCNSHYRHTELEHVGVLSACFACLF